jgi:small subunit ribosomal protein S16
MLKIRLSRQGRKGRPFYRVVLTEHTKPVKSSFKEVLGWFDPLAHKMEVNVDMVKSWISKWAQLSERIAKLLFAETKDPLFQKFYTERTRVAKTKKEKAN